MYDKLHNNNKTYGISRNETSLVSFSSNCPEKKKENENLKHVAKLEKINSLKLKKWRRGIIFLERPESLFSKRRPFDFHHYRPPTLILVKKNYEILPFFHDILGHFWPNLYDILWQSKNRTFLWEFSSNNYLMLANITVLSGT